MSIVGDEPAAVVTFKAQFGHFAVSFPKDGQVVTWGGASWQSALGKALPYVTEEEIAATARVLAILSGGA